MISLDGKYQHLKWDDVPVETNLRSVSCRVGNSGGNNSSDIGGDCNRGGGGDGDRDRDRDREARTGRRTVTQT